MTAYRARWLFTGTGDVIENGVVKVDDNRIAAVKESGPYDVDLGDVLLMPGLINAHTHLEFSDLHAPLEPRVDFAQWIRAVIQHRQQQVLPLGERISNGINLSIRAGVTSLGEIATTDWRVEFADKSVLNKPCIVMFREYLGLNGALVQKQLIDAQAFIEETTENSTIQPALSPHAPYSVHPQLFEGLCQLGDQSAVPVAMHLAESTDELELLKAGTGKLVRLFEEMGVWQPAAIPRGTTPMDYLRQLANLPKALVIHGNYLTAEEMTFISRHSRLSVVYCPRTHAAMQSDDHPWKSMLAQGINVALGTDSLASNPDLSIWKESQFLHKHHPDVPIATLLKMMTVNAAEALGLKERGKLKSGYQADLCVVRPGPATRHRNNRFLAETSSTSLIMHQGEWIKQTSNY